MYKGLQWFSYFNQPTQFFLRIKIFQFNDFPNRFARRNQAGGDFEEAKVIQASRQASLGAVSKTQIYKSLISQETIPCAGSIVVSIFPCQGSDPGSNPG